MTEHVFVYGILLTEEGDAEPATLDGYRLAFYDGLATIEPADGEYVAGALLRVEPWKLQRFDGIEGYRPDDPEAGLYRRELFTVDTESDAVFAWAYVKNRNHEPDVPYAGMLATIHRGYLRWGHDDSLLDAAVERARAGGRREAWT